MPDELLRFLEEYCRGLTLGDVREWFFDSSGAEATVYSWTNTTPYDRSPFPALEAFKGR